MQFILNCLCYIFLQLYLAVYDNARPGNRAVTALIITVLRNPGTPSFGANEIQLNVLENQPIGFTINQLTATDTDNVSKIVSATFEANKAQWFFLDVLAYKAGLCRE
jgi:hypothetical protein